MKQDKKNPSLLVSFKCAFVGIAHTIKHERNIKIELAVAVAALIASVLLCLEPLEWAVIIIFIVMVLSLELANSSLESAVDLMSPTSHPLAKQAKDAMAGAVLIAALGSVVVGMIIFITAALRLWGV